MDGVPAISIYGPGSARPDYFIRLTWEHRRLVEIQDFYYVPYIAEEARFTRG